MKWLSTYTWAMNADIENPVSPLVAIIRRWALAGTTLIAIASVLAWMPYPGDAAWMDLPSHFLLQYLIGIAFLIAMGRYARFGWRPYTVLAVSAVLCIALTGPYFAKSPKPSATSGSIKLLQANVLFLNKDASRLAAVIALEKPDIIILAEANSVFAKALNRVKGDYPYQQAQPEDQSADGIAVASRIKLKNLRIVNWKDADMPAYSFSFEWKDRTVHFFSLHTANPINDIAGRDAAITGLSTEIAATTGPLLAVGDFNATPWSPALRKLMARFPDLHNAREGRGLYLSWPSFLPAFMRIPIDQTLVRGFDVADYRLGPDIGSDHFPIISTLVLKEAK